MTFPNFEIENKDAVCETHGEYQSKRLFESIWSKCPRCLEEKELKEAEERHLKEKEQALMEWERKVGEAGIPLRFQDRRLSTFNAQTEEQKNALEISTNYAVNFKDYLEKGSSLIFSGMPGTGKTHLACAIGMHIIHHFKMNVLFTTTYKAIRKVKSTWHRDSPMIEAEAVAMFIHPKLLILDEVGMQFGTEAESIILFNIINERYERRLPTLMISNLSMIEIKDYLGQRVWDRLKEDDGDVVVFDWESQRGNMAGSHLRVVK